MEHPKHGTIETVTIPARVERRRWCGHCCCWTWEVAHSGVFRHPKKFRTPECREASR